MADADQVTRLLEEFAAGRRQALDEVIPLVYDELRRIAHAHLARERSGHTLDTTALMHEAYMRLVRLDRIGWQGRIHFLAMASRTMRRVLIDYAKGRAREKRGGGFALTLPPDIAATTAPGSMDDLLALDEALRRLEEVSPRQVRLVECRFFGGLSLEETAEALGVSLATVKRDWLLCRAWLNRALAASDTQPAAPAHAPDQDPPPSVA